MTVKQCPIVASTPEDAEYFFGYHDLCPWNADDDTLLALRAPRAAERGHAEVCLWKPAGGEIRPIGETTAWNWQQGARAQWLPGRDQALIYNIAQGGQPAAVIHDLRDASHETLPYTIYDISPDGRHALSPNFARLGRHWSSYGYPIEGGSDLDEAAPAGDGIHRLDIKTGKVELIVSIADAARVDGADLVEKPHFVAHPTYNPSGSHFCFLDRFITADRALYSRMIVADRDGNDLRLVGDEKVSHFDWYDDDTLLVWTRNLPKRLTALRRSGLTQWPVLRLAIKTLRAMRPSTKQRMFNEAYYWISRAQGVTGVFGFGALEQDGHPMFSPDRQWLVTDTYPDPADGNRQRLILYDMKAGRRVDIAALPASIPYLLDATGDKCDLHPRWNRAGTQICVDSTNTGTRRMHILDVSAVVGTSSKANVS